MLSRHAITAELKVRVDAVAINVLVMAICIIIEQHGFPRIIFLI